MAHVHEPRIPNWKPDEAAALVARWSSSGESCRAFCDAQGIDLKRFYRWRRKLRPPMDGAVVAPAASGFALALPSPGVRVRLACGAQIEVDPGFDAGLLRQVLAALC